MKGRGFRIVLVLALTATLVAAYFAPPAADDGVALSAHAVASAQPAGVDASRAEVRRSATVRGGDVLEIRRRDVDEGAEGREGVFGKAGWTVPPQKAVLPPAPAIQATAPVAQQAPPLPFRVLGRYVEEGEVAIFLQHNDQSLVVRVGDTLANNYKVESLEGGTLTLLYLPLNQKQTLEVGAGESREVR